MGCRLPTLRRPEERSPGKIYSTLRRPQVETKVGVAYTYHFLDFLLGKEEVSVSSVLCLSSVRELPVQLRDLYAQGFVLVALHPFVHPCGPRHARVQRLLHRAVLVRETHSQEKTQLKWAGHRLETDVCVTGHQVPDPEMIQNYVKKVQDVSDQGVLFVGFLQQLGGPPCFPGHLDPEELSSLHSSPSPVHRTPPTGGTSTSASLSPTEPGEQNLPEPRDHLEQEPEHGVLEPREPDFGSLERSQVLQAFPERRAEEPTGGEQKRGSVKALKEPDFDPVEPTETPGRTGWNPDAWNRREGRNPSPDRRYRKAERTYLDPDGEWNGVGCGRDREPQSGSEEPLHRGSAVERGRHGDGLILDASHLEELHRTSRLPTHNNNHIQVKRSEREKKTATSPPAQTRMQLFALYNHVGEPCSSLRFYSLRVPLQVQREAGLVTAVDAHWLDHMTQHFTGGARLIDGFFHLGDSGDNGFSSVDSVFIFQSSSEEATPTSYDAIVVEQWTVVDGVVVRTDYIPLLQSLAPFGWRLMCVLPTPIVKANSDGSLSTKQILFLQRPTLQRKRKDFKKLNLRGWSKATKNLTRETPEKNEERENGSPLTGRTGRNVRGEGEERESQENRENRRKDGGGGECPRRDGGGGKEGERGSQEGETTDANQEEETTGAEPIPSANQKSVRWTDERERGGPGTERGARQRSAGISAKERCSPECVDILDSETAQSELN